MPKKTKKKTQNEPKKVGRPRVNLEFYEARELVRQENIQSVGQYRKWWLYNTPAKIPKRPDRAYKKEWQGWGDFLGCNNEFPFVKKKVRPFKEARSYVQQLGLKNKHEWTAYAKTDKKPVDIPSRPDLIYRDDWFTWKDFLGADIASVKRNIETSDAIFFIIQRKGRPSNVYQLGITLEGKQAVLDASVQEQFRIIGLYYAEIDVPWEQVARSCGKQFWDTGRRDEYLLPNISDFIFRIEEYVEPIRF